MTPNGPVITVSGSVQLWLFFGYDNLTCKHYGSMAEYLLTVPTTAVQNDFMCKNGHISRTRRTNNTCCLLSIGSTMSISVENWMQELKEESNVTFSSESCSEKMEIRHQFPPPLPFIALDFSRYHQLQLDHTFHISINNEEYIYQLRGIVYYGD